ncbi:MAG: hypothetical protein QOF04_2170, partial [Solirubrobacteraceae bacterium]|nr:hypothetical protein [Solirubrobacteraceae bacterium]
PGSSLDDATWASRHRAMLVLLVAQAVVIALWSAATNSSAWHLLLEVMPPAAAFAAAASSRLTPRARASAMAIGLFTESALAVHLAGGPVVVHFHYFVMLCVLALYEDIAPFGLGVGYVVVQHGIMGSAAPEHVFGSGGVPSHPWMWAAIHGVFVLAAAVALMANWRANANVRISERRHRERAERYLDVAGAMLVVLDVDGRIRVANRLTCATLQRDEAGVVGEDWFQLAMPEAERADARGLHAALMAGDLDGDEVEHGVARADGTTRTVRWTITLVHDDDGRVAGTLSSGTDVTERRALDDRLAREQRDLAGLRRLAQDVASLEDARHAVVEHVAELTDAVFSALLEPADNLDLVVIAATPGHIVGERIRVGRETSGSATALMSGRPFFVADGHGHPAVHQRLLSAMGATSIVYQPVVVDGAARGVLVVGWAERVDSLGGRQTDLVELAAGEAAVALQRLGAVRRLRSAAMQDALTGVPNRRAFDDELPAALVRAERSGGTLALAYMDLNGFKAVNDREGHQAGDRLLKEVASAWQAQLRQDDMLARLGGDEFAVLIPDCRPGDADAVAERLRGAVSGPGSAVGIVLWDGEETGPALMRRADHALYADKASGGRARLSEPTRLAALEATGLLGAPAVPELDELSRVAAWMMDVPVVTVSLVDDERQIFAGQCGVEGWASEDRGTPLSHSFCQHAVITGRPLIIADARTSPLLRDNPAIRDQRVIAYAGIPLVDGDGNTLGVLCAIDHEPRAWTDDDVTTLRRLAQRAIEEITALGMDGAARSGVGAGAVIAPPTRRTRAE